MLKNKQEGFCKSVISLIFSQGIIKIFGLIYSMYLINKKGFGDRGNAIYMGGYQIYVLLLTISSIGVPNAIARLIAENIALNNYKGANKIFKLAILSFGIIGFIGSLILFLGANYISNKILLIPECEYSLIALSPAVFFVTLSSVIRGYFNGINKITKTAKSQTIEQILKCILTICFVELIDKYNKANTVFMASIANFASTCSICISFCYIVVSYIKLRKIQKLEKVKSPYFKEENTKVILKRIFKVSIPITVASILGVLNKNIDSITVVRILTPILGENIAKLKYGILSSKIDMLTLMPLSFNIAFSTTLVPNISSAIAKNDINSINKKIYFSLLITAIISFPAAVGLSVYSSQILNLLFPNSNSGSELLKISSFCIIFMSFTQTMGGVLQGIGKTNISLSALLIGLIIKFILNFLLIPINNIYEKGAVISNLLSNIVTFSIVWNLLKRNINIKFKLFHLIFKPLIATLIMIILSYSTYNVFIFCNLNQNISTIFGIMIASISYVFFIFTMKVFSKEEIYFLPIGYQIYKIFKFFKIYD